MDNLRIIRRKTLYLVLCYLPKKFPATLFDVKFFAIAQV